ncbi:membrane-binding protein [Polaribacter reichenbachii]|uniref:Membrane-binding protein n=1 Tax=Polaribacter reichenbachii TaxID=996801 RepID=A0A1B8U6V9_9FLAO|nr:membrane-binding protein [Polaribacter reichenbachii]APZ46264.1 membrane-binding protein [Polaribacter reichenbachii]AUC20127.1 membrane-binding protein [Polaribacter reichenbachii]OBY67614.1 membrane-binding protein [Polaribacter reichenbachii]
MNQKILLILIVVFLFFGCLKTTNKNGIDKKELSNKNLSIPNIYTIKSKLFYDATKSAWTLNNNLYSGYLVDFYDNKLPKEKIGILKGKKHNLDIQWYADGHYKRITAYKNGKIHGDKKIWSSDIKHTLVAHYKFVSGKPHGEQKKWYVTGEIFKKMNLNMGKEQGLQQAYRKNGSLYANYEAKEGRVFGLKKAELCYSLENEKIKTIQ